MIIMLITNKSEPIRSHNDLTGKDKRAVINKFLIPESSKSEPVLIVGAEDEDPRR